MRAAATTSCPKGVQSARELLEVTIMLRVPIIVVTQVTARKQVSHTAIGRRVAPNC